MPVCTTVAPSYIRPSSVHVYVIHLLLLCVILYLVFRVPSSYITSFGWQLESCRYIHAYDRYIYTKYWSSVTLYRRYLCTSVVGGGHTLCCSTRSNGGVYQETYCHECLPRTGQMCIMFSPLFLVCVVGLHVYIWMLLLCVHC